MIKQASSQRLRDGPDYVNGSVHHINRLEDKSIHVDLTRCRKIYLSPHDISSRKTRGTRDTHQHDRGDLQQARSQQQPIQREDLSISTKTRNKTKFSITIHYSTQKIFTRAIRQLKEIQEGKEEVKVSLFVDDIVVYVSDPKNQETSIANKHYQQSSRIQNHHTKISSSPVYR